ncbi:hypothetical protein BLNAU_5438 [Blattamonas nauphoetae]|uniref:Secreted protein n=1 Tax=Blattamonas nauphoetae TaxID=2049346 RepID=A0ABQ9Y7I4_9EUKA|nr:hypothetical protein BLNAU_5438 [Blattamonas nauphoetae]
MKFESDFAVLFFCGLDVRIGWLLPDVACATTARSENTIPKMRVSRLQHQWVGQKTELFLSESDGNHKTRSDTIFIDQPSCAIPIRR